MNTTRTLLKSSSSKQWLARQAKDPFVRSRAGSSGSSSSSGYRARSSFKLAELTRQHPALLHARAVVDLGAAPGGWSQVAADHVRRRSKGASGNIPTAVVAVDLLPMDPLRGVSILRGDFFDPSIQEQIRECLRDVSATCSADTVLSDMMAPMSGNRTRDVQANLDLVGAATEFAHGVLKRGTEDKAGGSLVLKFFMHPDLVAFRKSHLEPFFTKVVTDKPKASRAESSEAYWVCLGYRGRGEGEGVAEGGEP